MALHPHIRMSRGWVCGFKIHWLYVTYQLKKIKLFVDFFSSCLALVLENKMLKDKGKSFHLLYRDVKRMLPYFHVLGQAKIKALDFWLIIGEWMLGSPEQSLLSWYDIILHLDVFNRTFVVSRTSPLLMEANALAVSLGGRVFLNVEERWALE